MEDIGTIVWTIWNVCKEGLNSFHQFLNSSDEDLKFTMEIAKDYLFLRFENIYSR